MSPLLDELDSTWSAGGRDAAIARLIDRLTEAGDATGLFYALLMQARVRLGVDPTPTRPTTELPEPVHAEYEIAIRDAGRAAGRLCLDRADPVRAWGFYRFLQEPEPVREFLRSWSPPAEIDDIHPYLDISMQQNLAPLWGLELSLERQGVCASLSAYAACAGHWSPADRQAGAVRLARAVHEQLTAALADAARVPPAPIRDLLAAHPELMHEDGYYVDLSHLESVVQLCLDAEDPTALAIATDLCEFGRRLPARFAPAGDPPLGTFDDYAAWFAARAGDEAALERFAGYAALGGVCPEAYVNLLLHLGRRGDALAAARKHLADADERSLRCPGLYELAKADPAALREIARERGDGVQYLAARIRLGQ